MQKIQLFIVLLLISVKVFSQETESDSTNFSIYYSSPKEYVVAGIDVQGIRYLDTQVLLQISGLNVGDKIMVPGEAITNSIRKLWNHGLFSDVKITADKISGDNIYLRINLQERPRLAEVNFTGVSKSEKDDINKKVLLLKGSQVTDNQVNTAKKAIKNLFLEKGFLNTDVNIIQRDDTTQRNSVILDINVDKKEKVKISELVFHDNKYLKSGILEHSMKKTKAKKIKNFFSSKKFLGEKYAEDKLNLIKKYNEKGYRDATIVKDSVTKLESNRIRVDIWVEEGDKYFFRSIKWVGNTVYPGEYLSAVLGIKKGDVFDQKLLDKRTKDDEDAVGNVYQNNGYLFSHVQPIETHIESDSIDLEMRISEGPQATIDKIMVSGNTKTNEHVARREIRTLPGDLYSREAIIRTVRELAQLGHFDQESINPDVRPHPENGTVDIDYQLVEKANDQIELSGGWGANMFVGTLGLKFSNFSVRNIMNKEAWRPLPSGDGQSLSLRAQTSGKFFKSYSVTFTEPWFGGRKPNSFTFSFSHQKVNYSANNTYSSMYNDQYSSGGYGSSYGGGYSPYGYGGYSPYGYGNYNSTYDPGSSYSYGDTSVASDQIQITTTAAIGYGYRLSWPDDYFTIYHELSFQHYKLQNMSGYYYFLSDGTGNGNGGFNNFSFKTAFGRNSMDNPLYTRSGSSFSLSLQFTPPYSLWNGVNYSDPKLTNAERYKWIEYHKWMFKGDWYSPITKNRNLVLHTKFEYGFLGYYNKYRKSPFEGFRVGGSGMSGYSPYGSDVISLRGYKDYSLSPTYGSNIYNKLSMELRYPVILKPSSTIYLLTFLEAGKAWNTFDEYNPFKLNRSAGAGVRIFLPMFGLMGIDWGYGFDEVPGQSADAAGSQFHFVIGQQF
jgi:outer membrane protein insertion porin family